METNVFISQLCLKIKTHCNARCKEGIGLRDRIAAAAAADLPVDVVVHVLACVLVCLSLFSERNLIVLLLLLSGLCGEPALLPRPSAM